MSSDIESNPARHEISMHGSGTRSDPYQIIYFSDLNSLRWFNTQGIHFRQMNDIIIPRGLYPIKAFGGFYNGDGNKIINLNSRDFGWHNIGLFEILEYHAELYDVHFENCKIGGGDYVGVIAGQMNGYVSNCSVSGTIRGINFVGGIAGVVNGTVYGCEVNGEVIGSESNAGGIAGFVTYSGSICNSYTTCNVRGFSYVGRITGYNSGSLRFCYATGNVQGDYRVGLLYGYNTGTEVYHCGTDIKWADDPDILVRRRR